MSRGQARGPRAMKAVGFLLVLTVSPGPGAAAQDVQPKTTLVSKTSTGEPATLGSVDPAVSRDGRFVTFTSRAHNLPGSETTQPQVYERDRLAGKTRLVSKNPSGKPAGDGAFVPAISAQGDYVAFRSSSENMPGGNGITEHIYLRDLAAGKTRLVSKNSQGEPLDRSSDNPSLSGNGRFVLFESDAFNAPGDDWTTKILIHDSQTGKTQLVSRTSSGEPAQSKSHLPSVSSDGRHVAFASYAQNLPGGAGVFSQVYVRDRLEGTTQLVSTAQDGEPADDFASFPSISANGNHVLFWSRATNLPGGNGEWSQLYVHTLSTGMTTLVSRNSSGDVGQGDSYDHAISGSGRFVSFASRATNLPGAGSDPQIYIHDRTSGSTNLISKDAVGEPATGLNEQSAISRDGMYVAFDSNALNLPAGDGGTLRVYIHGPL